MLLGMWSVGFGSRGFICLFPVFDAEALHGVVLQDARFSDGQDLSVLCEEVADS